MNFRHALLCGLMAMGTNLGLSALAQADIIVDTRVTPLAPLYEPVLPNRPSYAWVPGYWNWDGSYYVWVPGHWSPDRVVIVERERGHHRGWREHRREHEAEEHEWFDR